MSDRTRKVAFAGAAALLVSLAVLLGARGSAPAGRQSAPAPSSPVIERTPTLPTPSRTVQPAPTRTVHARKTAHREREPGRAPAPRGTPRPRGGGPGPPPRRRTGRRTRCHDHRARLPARLPAL